MASLDNGEYDKILFVFDADFSKDNHKTGGFKNSKRQIESIIKQIKEELEFDFYSEYHIMCDPNTKDGNLEHLIISTLSEKKEICVNNLLECISPHKHKGNKKIVLSSYKAIFDEHEYNFSHQNFDILKNKLKMIDGINNLKGTIDE